MRNSKMHVADIYACRRALFNCLEKILAETGVW